MGILSKIASGLKGSGCRRLVKQTANEIVIDSAGVGMGEFKIDIGHFSNKIKDFYRVTQVTITLDNSQFLLCEEIARIKNDEQLKQECTRIRLQLILAFSQLQAILGSMDEKPTNKLNAELGRWVRYMSKLNQQSIEILSPRKGISPSAKSELKEIMQYQGINENEIREAMNVLK